MEKPNLSIILTAHSEGLLAHKTLRNIFSAVKLLEKKNVSYEIIVHIDNGTKETLNYFSRYEKDPRFKIFKNNFKGLFPLTVITKCFLYSSCCTIHP